VVPSNKPSTASAAEGILESAGGHGVSRVGLMYYSSHELVTVTHCMMLVLVCRKFADDFHKMGLPLHVLVNNAGVHLKVCGCAVGGCGARH